MKVVAATILSMAGRLSFEAQTCVRHGSRALSITTSALEQSCCTSRATRPMMLSGFCLLSWHISTWPVGSDVARNGHCKRITCNATYIMTQVPPSASLLRCVAINLSWTTFTETRNFTMATAIPIDSEKAHDLNEGSASQSVASGEVILNEAEIINEKALLRKLDLRLLPPLTILYLLSVLDRSNGSSPPPNSLPACAPN